MENLKFNKTDYDHLNKASLEEWISEFVSRNESFREDFKKALQMSLDDILKKGEEEFNKKYKVSIPLKYLMLKNRKTIDIKDKIKIILRPPVYAIRIFDKIEDEDTRVKKLEKKRQDLLNRLNETYLRFTSWWAGLNIKDSKEIATAILGDCDKNGYFMCGDNLLLIVDMNNPQELIEKYIKKILQIHEPRKKVKKRDDKWKYYLIVYDFKKEYPNLTYDEIADKLVKEYRYITIKKQKVDSLEYFTAKNCENLYKSALELIEGGYKKYLP